MSAEGQIKERLILMSAPMVRAILEGRKTQMRRLVKGGPFWTHLREIPVADPLLQFVDEYGRWVQLPAKDDGFTYSTGVLTDEGGLVACPFGKPGERLWVRESHWRFTGCSYRGQPWQGFTVAPSGDPFQARCYDDSKTLEAAQHACAVVRVPSIHMPRWASRITLEITEVWVQRLQEISEADAIAEGADPWACGNEQCMTSGERGCVSPHRGGFACLWDEINADRATWKSNPWVWAVSFKVVQP